MEFEPGNEFEQELRQALERRPAPPGLKRRLMEKRSRRHTERLHTYTMIWERLGAWRGAPMRIAWRNAPGAKRPGNRC